jgi:hypothetical protein
MKSELPHEATLITNYSYIAYFSGLGYRWTPNSYKFTVQDLTTSKFEWISADYLAISVKERDRELWLNFVAKHSLCKVRTFDGGRHGNLHIVKINRETHLQMPRKVVTHDTKLPPPLKDCRT